MKKRNWPWIFGLAYVIDRLFSKRKQENNPELTMEVVCTPGPLREPIIFVPPKDILCPYCSYRFAQMPKRSQKCPSCKKYIYRTKDYENKLYQLITEEQYNQETKTEAKEQWVESVKHARSTLHRFQRSGARQVKISDSGESSCHACRNQHGKIYSIEDALKEMPIPCKSCTYGMEDVQAEFGYCRCVFIPIV